MHQRDRQQFSEKYDQQYVLLDQNRVIGVNLDEECIRLESDCSAVRVNAIGCNYAEAHKLTEPITTTDVGTIARTKCVEIDVE